MKLKVLTVLFSVIGTVALASEPKSSKKEENYALCQISCLSSISLGHDISGGWSATKYQKDISTVRYEYCLRKCFLDYEHALKNQ